jgi:hypothetical protein
MMTMAIQPVRKWNSAHRRLADGPNGYNPPAVITLSHAGLEALRAFQSAKGHM